MMAIQIFDMAPPQAPVRHEPAARSNNTGLIIWFHFVT
jgi:hypothetical protein